VAADASLPGVDLSPAALRFVLAQKLPAVIEVSGGSMEPALAKGVKVSVEAVNPGEVQVGDIVLLATDDASILILHRVMHVFEESGRRFVVHQGDAPSSTFGICAGEGLLGRVTGFSDDTSRPLPTPERLGAREAARFARRCLACAGFVGARRLALRLGIRERPLVGRCAQAYRTLARRLLG
jgi:hypothetical protein